jgi:hypothetical protein
VTLGIDRNKSLWSEGSRWDRSGGFWDCNSIEKDRLIPGMIPGCGEIAKVPFTE